MPPARVLVVDDEPEVAELVREVLARAGYEVAVAMAATDALALVQVVAPDAIVLDIGMPGMDGLTALQRLRTLLPDVPIIMLTANADEEVGRTALRWGAFDYIAKPFESAQLVRVVEAAVGHRGGVGMPSLDRLYVLVVDDNMDARDIFKLGLEHEGAVVHVASSAPEALGMITTVVPDVIITDMAMPPMDGYEFLAAIKSKPAWQHIPVIAVSGYAQTYRGPRVRAAGFADYLLKPVDPARLAAAILRVIAPNPA